MSDEQRPPPGWYPWSTQLSRYWDGSRWTDQTRPLGWQTTPQAYLRTHSKWHQRRWVRRGLAFGVVLLIGAIGSTIEKQQRSETDLGPSQSGSQQEWIEYFERSNASVGQFNTAIGGEFNHDALTQILDALDQVSDSPDVLLNATVEKAIEACESYDAEACFTNLDAVADRYNAALDEAREDGLIEVSE